MLDSNDAEDLEDLREYFFATKKLIRPRPQGESEDTGDDTAMWQSLISG